MARPNHQLDLYLVPSDPDADVSVAMGGVIEEWTRAGVLTHSRRGGAQASALVVGGFVSARVDIPGQVSIYGNRLGGFRVRCPRCARNVVPEFNAAVTAWRAGAPRSATCGSCGEGWPLESADFAPVAAFGRCAIQLVDVASPHTGPALAALESAIGSVITVGVRPYR